MADARPVTTLAEYMDARRFPLTTQSGLTPERQFMTDALGREARAGGVTFTEEDTARTRELEEKAVARQALLKQWERGATP
jgi:hypothetical protein